MKRWIVQPHHKKSVEEIEYFKKDNLEISHSIGWRWGSWIVTTSNDEIPEFEFEAATGGDGQKDSIDMNACAINNIEDVEMIETIDGCWEQTNFPEDLDEEEIERLEEIIEEEGSYILEENEGWSAWETEMWVTGPIEILNEDKECVLIIISDKDGNPVEYKEDQ